MVFTTVNFMMLILVLILASGFFLVLFGQITVRKYRRNPKIAPYLGISLLNGWDIFNVASALSLPLWFLEKISNNLGDALNGKYKILRSNATKLDFILAKLAFYSFYSMVFLLVITMILDKFKIIE